MEVVVGANALEKVADRFGHGVEVGCSFWLFVRVALLGGGTECLVDFPIRFLAVTAAVPLIGTSGTAFESNVCLSSAARGACLLDGIHGREAVDRRSQEDDGIFQECLVMSRRLML